MARKGSYPDWVTAHIQKGQYVNKVNGKYYLYQAHSERREGIDHPVRVCDGYLGRITEEGFIPAKKRKESPERSGSKGKSINGPEVWQYGVYQAVVSASTQILSDLRERYGDDRGTKIYVASVAKYICGMNTKELISASILSFIYPAAVENIDADNGMDELIRTASQSIQAVVQDRYGEEWPLLRALLANVVLIRNRGKYSMSRICPETFALLDQAGIHFDLDALTDEF